METGEKIRKSLHTMLTQAEIDLEMWQAMRKARSDKEVVIMLNRGYGRFYIAAENALFNSLISILYKAFETRKDTVNFGQLLKTLPSDMDPEINAELEDLYRKIKRTWVKIGLVRNKVVGHQSLEQSVEEVHRLAAVTIVELEEVVKDAQHLLYLIAKHFHDTHVIFNLKGTQSFDNLLNDLRANNSLKPMSLRGTLNSSISQHNMKSSDLPAEIKSQAIDYVAAGAKSALGAVPFAGSLLVELAGTIIPNQRIERIAKFAAALEKRIRHLEESEVRAELSDEAFNELVEEALRQASRSTSDERRDYLASLVAHSLTDDEITNSEHRHLLRLLGELSDVEVVWLRSLMGSYTGQLDEFRRTHNNVLQPVRVHLGSGQQQLDKHTLQSSYISHLVSLGLAKRVLKLDRNKEPQLDNATKEFAYGSPSITPLGRMLLRTTGFAAEGEGAG